MQILIYVFSGFLVWAFGPSGEWGGGQERFWHCRMFDSNPDLHPLDGSSTHVPAGTIKGGPGDSLEVQWLGLHLPAGSTGLIPGWGTKIPHEIHSAASRPGLPDSKMSRRC